MPYLGDYLGQLLSEITIASMQADLEAVRLAELYAGHPLLRHMPVPHFRLPDVEIEVPIVIKQMEEQTPETPIRGAPNVEELRKTFNEVLEKQLEKTNIRLTSDIEKKLKAALDENIAVAAQPPEVAVDVKHIADSLAKLTSRLLSSQKVAFESTGAKSVENFEAELKEAARVEFLKLRRPPPRLLALVTTGELREAGPSENLTRFRLKITEQAVEWTTIESEGQKQDRLVPE